MTEGQSKTLTVRSHYSDYIYKPGWPPCKDVYADHAHWGETQSHWIHLHNAPCKSNVNINIVSTFRSKNNKAQYVSSIQILKMPTYRPYSFFYTNINKHNDILSVIKLEGGELELQVQTAFCQKDGSLKLFSITFWSHLSLHTYKVCHFNIIGLWSKV